VLYWLQDEFDATIQQGFQATATWHQGSLVDRETGSTGTLHSTVDSCKWAFSVQPLCGWGDQGDRQRATAGWPAMLPVFEPHWQVSLQS
jgi:tocopherol cyclase